MRVRIRIGSLQDSEPTMGIIDHPYLDREYDVQGIVPARLCASAGRLAILKVMDCTCKMSDVDRV